VEKSGIRFAKKISKIALVMKATTGHSTTIQQLQRDILSLQGLAPPLHQFPIDVGLDAIADAFPLRNFPVAAVHEFLCPRTEERAPTQGFMATLLSRLMQQTGVIVWVGGAGQVYPPALAAFGIAPERVVFVTVYKEKEILWAVEEALKCDTISAVIGDLPDINLASSRRLQLAVEHSGVACFLLRHRPREKTTASVTRWNIRSLPSISEQGLPGLTFPRWQVDLLKVRNGKPGSWQMQWNGEALICTPTEVQPQVHELQKRAV